MQLKVAMLTLNGSLTIVDNLKEAAGAVKTKNQFSCNSC